MTSRAQAILGPILNVQKWGRVEFFAEGLLACDDVGTITFIGDAAAAPPELRSSARRSGGIVCPPFLDAHIHIPQHPIRGHFMDGIGENPPQGRLLAGLNRNVFPAEVKCADAAVTEQVVADFAADTLAKGVVGGAAYMTVHPSAARIALQKLRPTWHLGPVLMNQNCPEYLRTDESTWQRDFESLAREFGRRMIVTDRFAVAVSSELRRAAVKFAADHGLRMQTHLNEQLAEKRFVEEVLYPSAGTYTDVYDNDGLLDQDSILAHCIWMCMGEFQWVSWHPGCVIAHCPTSNTLLCSGIMPLHRLYENGIDYAICTDVGASPTTSILAEMAQYLKVHAGRSDHATPSEALYRATVSPARMLGLYDELGTLEIGKPMSFVEVRAENGPFASADDAIRRGLLEMKNDYERGGYQAALKDLEKGTLDCGSNLNLLEQDVRDTARRLDDKVISVTLAGEEIWRRNA